MLLSSEWIVHVFGVYLAYWPTREFTSVHRIRAEEDKWRKQVGSELEAKNAIAEWKLLKKCQLLSIVPNAFSSFWFQKYLHSFHLIPLADIALPLLKMFSPFRESTVKNFSPYLLKIRFF